MNLQESIKRVLREETNVPLSFRRRITNSDIEEEFLKALDSIDYSRLHNQFSPIKNISLKTFAKLVIDEMYLHTLNYFSDEDSILFDDDEIYHEKIRVPLINYFGDRIKKRYNGGGTDLKESIKRILREDNYSPAGKEIIPNSIVVHKSNPIFRENIMAEGLKVNVGECYENYANREEDGYDKIKCKPVIFATNSTKKMDLFDSTYDDDIWEINTKMIPNVKWYKDKHFGSELIHIVTFQDIPREAITLIYEGTGDSEDLLQEHIKRILREEVNESTFFIRRVDMELFEKEFYENLNYATSIFLERYNEGEITTFSKFKKRVLDYLIDNYHSELTNGGLGDYPYDEVYEYFSNHFHNKIKNRYDKVFGGDINESTYLRRRVDWDSLDDEFDENLNIITDRFFLRKEETLFIGKLTGRHISNQSYNFNDFKDAVLSYIIEDFHYELTNNGLDDYPEDEVYEFLSNYYHDKIKDRYDEVFRDDKVGKTLKN